ncbi:MAG: hypothetical protein KF684_00020 [Phycisphaeraceae bacterium]|nr:hypothetical protein [Phycisphaeraceae bacterium]
MSNGKAHSGGGNVPLPYWDEYLATILRPRVEKIAMGLAAKVESSAMDALARRISEEQPNFPGGPEAIEQILRENLGLRFKVTVQPVFGNQEGEAAVHHGGEFPVQDGMTEDAEPSAHDDGALEILDQDDLIVKRRAFDNPLARAVGIRKDRGR